MSNLAEAIWLFFPAAMANATPVIATKIPVINRWTTPMDFGRSFNGKRITGDNKTYRGLAFGVFAAALTGYVQYRFFQPDGPAFTWVILAGLMGFGGLYGDAVESFFKRQRGVPSGSTWFPFDQIDYIIGGLLAVAPAGLFDWQQVGAIFVVYFLLHILASFVAYKIGFKKKPI